MMTMFLQGEPGSRGPSGLPGVFGPGGDTGVEGAKGQKGLLGQTVSKAVAYSRFLFKKAVCLIVSHNLSFLISGPSREYWSPGTNIGQTNKTSKHQ